MYGFKRPSRVIAVIYTKVEHIAGIRKPKTDGMVCKDFHKIKYIRGILPEDMKKIKEMGVPRRENIARNK